MSRPPASLLLTRPMRQSKRFLDQCQKEVGHAIAAVISPVIEIVPTRAEVRLSSYHGVVFTSENAVASLPEGAGGAGIAAYCVGSQTAEVAREAGFSVMSAEGNAKDLVRLIARTQPSGPLLHLRGRYAAADIVGQLARHGVTAEDRILYDQVGQSLTDEARACLESPTGPVVAPLFSPRSARLLRKAVSAVSPLVQPVAISSNAAAAWADVPTDPRIAEQPTARAMVAAVCAELVADSAC